MDKIQALENENKKLKEIIEEHRKEKNKYYMDDLIDSACEELEDIIKHEELDINCDVVSIDETIQEIADNNVPIYYYDIGRYASHNSHLMTEKAELNPEGTPHDQIQSNIYSEIVDGLHAHIAKKESEEL